MTTEAKQPDPDIPPPKRPLSDIRKCPYCFDTGIAWTIDTSEFAHPITCPNCTDKPSNPINEPPAP